MSELNVTVACSKKTDRKAVVIRHAYGEEPPGSQHPFGFPHERERRRQVLERVPHRDHVRGAWREQAGRKASSDGVEAPATGYGDRRLGNIDPCDMDETHRLRR